LNVKSKRFGFDLDNTLIDYSHSVQEYCSNNSLEECKSIEELRILLRESDKSGHLWQLAQGWLYTDGLSFAQHMPGASELCAYLKDKNFEIFIVSHKTTHTPIFCGRKPLREIATNWIISGESAPFFLDTGKINFESTRPLKVGRIQKLGLDYFVDDLVEVFQEPGYPRDINSFFLSERQSELTWVRDVPTLCSIREFIENE